MKKKSKRIQDLTDAVLKIKTIPSTSYEAFNNKNRINALLIRLVKISPHIKETLSVSNELDSISLAIYSLEHLK